MLEFPNYLDKLLSGKTCSILHDNNLSSGDSSSVYLENSTDDKVLVIDTIELDSDAASTATYYRNPDITNGSEYTVDRDLIDGQLNETCPYTIRVNGEMSNADRRVTVPLSSTSGSAKSATSQRPPIALEPGATVGYEISSEANNNNTLILLSYWTTTPYNR